MKAVAYARFSSDNQRDESIDAQLRAIREYAASRSFALTHVYKDEARSATTDNRPEFLQMMQDAAHGLFDVVIIHKLDRFSRDRFDSAFYKRHLKRHGVRLYSVLEHLDDSPEGIILESVLEGMAEYYSRNLAREVMKGMRETAHQAKHNGGKPPLGYDVAPDKTYIISETQAQAVRIIFEMYADGSGYSAIIDKLKKDGHFPQSGRMFSKNSLHDILKNEKYRGVYIFNRTARKEFGKRNHRKSKPPEDIIRIENGMPQIVSNETWERVQKRMSENRKGKNAAKEIYLLSGIIKCGKCGGAMTGTRKFAGRDKTLYRSYECSTRKRNKGCDMKAISKEFVEAAVINQLAEDLFTPEALEKMVEKLIAYSSKQNNQISHDLKIIEHDLTSVQRKITNIIDSIADGFRHPSMKGQLDSLETKKASLIIRLDEAKRQHAVHAPSEEMIRAYLQKDADIKNMSLGEQKRIVQAYVKEVVVYDDTVIINTIVTFVGGGEGSRTPVRRPTSKSFYECILKFGFA